VLFRSLKDDVNNGNSNNIIPQVTSTGIDGVSETDKAAPVIVGFRGRVGYNDMSIEFSEPVDGNGGACGQNLSVSSFEYIDASGGGAQAISSITDADGCDYYVQVLLDKPLTLDDMNTDRIRPAHNAIYDAANNVADNTITGTAVNHTKAPYVLGVNGYRTKKIRITYSEPVNSAAMDLSSYSLSVESTSGSPCIGGSDSVSLTGSVTMITDNTVFELATNNDQCPTTTYKLTVTGAVKDLDGLDLIEPKFGTFLGSEQLKVSSATCLTLNTMMVVFNKPVMSGTGTGGAELSGTSGRYKFNNNLLGTINNARRGSGVNANQVTLTHTGNQFGATFMVIGSNGINNDGFNDATIGAIQTDTLDESLQQSPKDRAYWNGCAAPITTFDGGPISLDPFGDGSDFGYLALYHNKVYIGPNKNGNSACRMDPDGSNPVINFFTFNKDNSSSNGTRTMDNGASSRDGSILVPPFVTVGHSGCTTGNAGINSGCGPDNENGRGLFVSGLINGAEQLFITGAKSSGNNDYLYHTADTDSNLDFRFIDLSATFNSDTISGNKGTESIIVFNNKVYWMEPGDYWYRPYFVKISNVDNAVNDQYAQSRSGTDSNWMYIKYMTGIGAHSSDKPNIADRIGGTLFGFHNRLYLANNGSVKLTNPPLFTSAQNVVPGCYATGPSSNTKCINDGGIVRSTNNDPSPCSGADNCSSWADITPDSNAKYTNYFSIIYGKVIVEGSQPKNQLGDVIPAERPIPAFAEFNGNLYMIRNACTVNMIDYRHTSSGTDSQTDDLSCTAAGGTEVPQLWKCIPDGNGECQKGGWSLVAENSSSGRTNFGNANNKQVTLLIANGSRLYVGFDNTTDGLQIWRTKDPVANPSSANPSSASDFEQIGGNGLGYPGTYKRLWSSITITSGSDYYIYVSAGDGSQPVAIFRQKNN
jgi:hypothetical protein